MLRPLTVASNDGKEATTGILVDGEFFGEGALAGQPLPHGVCNRNDGLRCSADRQDGHDGSTSSGTRVVRPIRIC